MQRFVYSAMEFGYFLHNSTNWMKIYKIEKFKLLKFKSRNTTNYTLKQDFKSEIIWIQYIVPCSILG
jgi:hypothetical protein